MSEDPMRQPVSDAAARKAAEVYVKITGETCQFDTACNGGGCVLHAMRLAIEAALAVMRGTPVETKTPPDNFDPRFTTFLTALEAEHFSLWHALKAVKKRWLMKVDE